ncbi:hypothetical protein ACIOEX_30345 [Streptomyces sp. NPDC087850]|uniref:hypothetical protein n=1 Tax=Streptomyces sp. NPDC087850 TaxID=3365809 RepID=UPI003819958B
MSKIVDRPQWTMPGWMEPYRAGFVGVRPQDVEEYYNDDSPAHINAARAIVGAQVKAQVGLLTSLWEAGLLDDSRIPVTTRIALTATAKVHPAGDGTQDVVVHMHETVEERRAETDERNRREEEEGVEPEDEDNLIDTHD